MLLPVGLPVPHRLTAQITKILVRTHLISPPTRPQRRRHIRLNYITVPLLAVLILLASGAIDGQVLKRGIVGADGVKPINIMALFISLVSKVFVCSTASEAKTSILGLYGNIARFHGAASLFSVLGSSQRRRIWPQALPLPLYLFPRLRSGGGQCESLLITNLARKIDHVVSGSCHPLWNCVPGIFY